MCGCMFRSPTGKRIYGVKMHIRTVVGQCSLNQDQANCSYCVKWVHLLPKGLHTRNNVNTDNWPLNKLRQKKRKANRESPEQSVTLIQFMIWQQCVHQLNFPGSPTVGLADINPATSLLFVTWLIISGLGRAQPTWQQLEVTDHIRVCLSLETKIKPCDPFKLIEKLQHSQESWIVSPLVHHIHKSVW